MNTSCITKPNTPQTSYKDGRNEKKTKKKVITMGCRGLFKTCLQGDIDNL